MINKIMYDKAAEIHEHAAETPDILPLTLTKISSQNTIVTRSLKQVGIKHLQVATESSPVVSAPDQILWLACLAALPNPRSPLCNHVRVTNSNPRG